MSIILFNYLNSNNIHINNIVEIGGGFGNWLRLNNQIQKLQSLTDTIKQKAALRGIDTSTVDYSIMPTLPNGMLDLNAPQNAASARLQAQADAYFKGLNELKITVDTTNTGDRFAQLIAESLQMATKSGLSSTPVGLP